ncbi:MAG TPA: methylmalonyl-CoA mutase family protein [Kofleriaceae bacterium]|nr:methylmalonyl-CoA mutase family protein [Kofleriaceae bacterium]
MAVPDLTAWRALVDKELAGAPFDRLVQRTAEGIAIEPLYTERPGDPPPPGAAPFVRGARREAPAFQLCMRLPPGADAAAELDAGTDALWIESIDRAALHAARVRGRIVVIGPDGVFEREAPAKLRQARLREQEWTTAERADSDQADRSDGEGGEAAGELWSTLDWISAMVRGGMPLDVHPYAPLAPPVEDALEHCPTWRCIRVTGLPFHELGADAADELALMLSSLVAALRHLDAAKLDTARVAPLLWAQISVGRDTFGELCKLRALRVVWHKVLMAAGVRSTGLDAIHAVCSERGLSQRDPWVNMLRVTTQVFAAALGGAQLITPLPFDAAFAQPSALGQRVARNTALVLRDESQLGRVLDAAGGSYYIEARTDALAREAWSRFTAIERDGGIVQLLRTGGLHARLAAAWKQRAAAISRRKEPVLGVSEFANLREQLPGAPLAPPGVHRDAEAFEALRGRVEAAPRDVALIQLGPPVEHRPRTGFAEGFFAVAGLRAVPREVGPGLDVACLCGSDERYAAEAVATARALRAAGARRVVLAGRPGALEAELRGAGVDAFLYLGCDVVATLEEILA